MKVDSHTPQDPRVWGKKGGWQTKHIAIDFISLTAFVGFASLAGSLQRGSTQSLT